MKLGFLILLLTAGVAKALEPQPSPHEEIIAEEIIIAPGGPYYFRKDEQVADPLCPSGWKDSYWSLIDTSTKTISRITMVSDAVFRDPETIPGHIGNVQVCKENGLLRVKPEEIRK